MLDLNDDPSLQPPAVPVDAVSVDVGVGKTRAWLECIAPALVQVGFPAVLSVPRHKLGEEIVRELASVGIVARVYRGRLADDPEQPGKKMCHDPERTNLVLDALSDVSSKACKHKDKVCEFYNECDYQRQRCQRPDIWIIPHQLLFRGRPDFIPQPASVVIDESFWRAALHGTDEPRKMWLHDLVELREIFTGRSNAARDAAKTADLREISARVFCPLALQEDGQLRRAALISAGITANDLGEAHRLEWMRKRDLAAYPGMPIAQVRKAVGLVERHNKEVANLARFWELLLRTIEADTERSPWLSMRQKTPLPDSKEERTAPAIYMAWRDDVHESWTMPTLLMDATMSPEIVSQFFPTATVEGRVTAPMPHTYVRQIIDRALTADMLIPVGGPNDHANSRRRANVERVRHFILVRADEVAPGRILVVCQQGLALALLGGPLPATVDIAHFNAITGLNVWEGVAVVIVIGRTAPPVRDVERIARALFGTEVQEVEPDEAGNIRYPPTRRGIRMRDGSGVAVDGPSHPDPRAEAIRWAICEGELVQAIGRGRGVNRTEANPLQIDILTNVCVPIEVDEVTTWKKIQPGTAQIMRARGAVPLSYADMATAYPDLFPSREAAKKTVGREAENWGQTLIKGISRRNWGQTPIERYLIGVCPQFSRQRYRRVGARGPAVVLLYDPARIEPGDWLRKHLGEVVLLDPKVDEGEASEPGEHAAPQARSFVENQIPDESGRPHEPVRGGLMRCDFDVPAAADVSQFIPASLRRAQIEIAPEFMVTLPSRHSLWLANIDDRIREENGSGQEAGADWSLQDERLEATIRPPSVPSFYAVVDEVTGGGYPSKEDWLEATRLWVERCRVRATPVTDTQRSEEPFPVDDMDFDEVEERLAIMTIDGGLTEAEARIRLGLQ